MCPESDVDVLLSTMEPTMAAPGYVFCSIEEERFAELSVNPMCTFRESEGVSAILRHEDAERCALSFSFPCRMITLNVHSSLDAVGFLAAITTELARHGVSVNAVSAYNHDHLFVPLAQAGRALQLLQKLRRNAQERCK